MPDYTTWMSNAQIQNLTFGALRIPGTHDSGSYSLELSLSQIKYDEIKFLWSLDPGTAPSDGNWPWAGGKYYVGKELYTRIMTVVKAISVAQDQNTLQQLNGGIRYFDLRVYYDTSTNDFHVQHGLRGSKLSEIFDQVRQFIQQHPTSQELIILELSHSNFNSLNARELTDKVSAMVRDYFGSNVYMPSGASGTIYEFQLLSPLTVGSITNNKPAVMLLNTDRKEYTYRSMVINTQGYAGSGGSPDGVNSVPALIQREDGPLRNNPVGHIYGVGWCLTPRTSDVMREIQNTLVSNGATPLLQQLALEANNALTTFMEAHQKCAFNLITVDWYETGGPKTVVDICVSLNMGHPI